MEEQKRNRNDYERCNGKVLFPTKGEASRVMLQLKSGGRRYDNTGKRINRRVGKPAYNRVYECPMCKGWHITSWDHKTQSKKQPKKWSDYES
jgi:hypothetical protein